MIKPSLRYFAEVLFIVLVACLFFEKFLFSSANESVQSDVVNYFNFLNWLIRDSVLTHREIPLWDNIRLAGIPNLANPQTSVFYFTTAIVCLATNEIVGIRIAIVVHAILSGLFMYYLMIVMKNRRTALIPVIGYMLNGAFITRVLAGHLTFLYGYTWIPLSVAFLKRSLEKNSLVYALFAGTALSMQIISGGVIVFLYTFLLVILLIICHVLLAIKNRARLGKEALVAVKVASSIAASCFGVAAIKLLPVMEFLPNTVRATQFTLFRSTETHLSNFLGLLATLLARDLLAYESFGMFGPVWEYCAFSGFIILGLAIAAPLIGKARDRFVFSLLSILFIMLAFGDKGPFFGLYRLSYHFLPFFTSLQHVPARFLILVVFTVSVLAGVSASAFFDRLKLEKRSTTVLFLILLALTTAEISTFGFKYIETTPVSYVPTGEFHTSLNPGDLSAVLTDYPKQITASPGSILEFSVKVRNIGDTIWLKESGEPTDPRLDVQKGAIYLHALVGDKEARQRIPRDVYPNETITMTVQLPGPTELGKYSLELGLEDALIRTFREPASVKATVPVGEVVVEPTPHKKIVQETEPIVLSSDVVRYLSFQTELQGKNSFRVYASPAYLLSEYTAARNHLEIASGTEVVPLTNYVDFLEFAKCSAKLLGLLNVKYVLTNEKQSYTGLKPVAGWFGSGLYMNSLFLPRVFCAQHGILVIGRSSAQFIRTLMMQDEFYPEEIAFVSGESLYTDDYNLEFLNRFDAVVLLDYLARDAVTHIRLLNGYQKSGGRVFYWPADLKSMLAFFEQQPKAVARILEYSHNKIVIRVDNNASRAYLVISEVFYSGWKAYVNGKREHVLLADSIITSLSLRDEGSYNVVLRFEPYSYEIGMQITTMSIIAIISVCIFKSYFKRRLSGNTPFEHRGQKNLVSRPTPVIS